MGDTLFPDLVVNGEHIPHTAVAAEVQNHTAPKGKPGLAWRKAAKALAMRALLLQEARRRGLTPVPEVLGLVAAQFPRDAVTYVVNTDLTVLTSLGDGVEEVTLAVPRHGFGQSLGFLTDDFV